MPGDSELVSLTEAAERLGVHYMTAYRYVRLGFLPATKVGRAWAVSVRDVERFERSADRPTVVADHGVTVDAMVDALLAGDESQAWAITCQWLDRVEPTQIHLELIAPALTEVGERWAAGSLSIAQEHRASAVAQRVVARVGSRFVTPGRKRGLVIIGAACGDLHALPSALFADLLRANGVAVIDLGAATPPSSFLEALGHHDGPVCVVVTVTSRDALPAAAETAETIRAAAPEAPIVVGGAAVTSQEQASQLGSALWAPDPLTAARLVADLASRR